MNAIRLRPGWFRVSLLALSCAWLSGCLDAAYDLQEDEPAALEPAAISVAGFADGSSMSVTSRRAVYWNGSSYRAAPGLEAFRAAGAPDSDLYKVRIAEVDAPSTREAIVLMSAGQKASSSGHSNGLTGQASDWDDSCNDVDCPGVSLDGRSLAMKLRALGWLPPSSTYLAVINDNNFDHLFGSDKKQEMLDGFVDWLGEQVRPETQTIYLAGSSRGGCLVMRMAKALRQDPAYNDISVLVSSFDGVCKKSQGELGTFNDKINNPDRPWGTFYGGWATNMNGQFPNHANLSIFHIVGGQEVVPASGIRAFSAYAGSSPPKTGSDLDWGWYRQSWVKWKHKEVGNPYSEPKSSDRSRAVSETIDAQLSWLGSRL
ncbi:hypothetical protein [Haliangium ochraceum]|uniref:Uncharacterized protein n=1 Tax=Haliangium ochraceum (strain DSM 14365 / JCM 11303 / SMP-2) TaxID=502025 RepID=D0LGW0_HALO1|nr:hypothetical protein [Haliangium ochraceum]ACY14682.1 conserved hypothetical protein [Haliangium ochraceum DSM 14365]